MNPFSFCNGFTHTAASMAIAAISLLSCLAMPAFTPCAHAQNKQGLANGAVFVPDTTAYNAADRGVRAHTNHLIFAYPAGGLGPSGGMTPAQIRSFYTNGGRKPGANGGWAQEAALDFSSEASYDSHFPRNNGIVYFASSGDTGGVVAVGDTSVATDSTGTFLAEAGWSGSGGGVSQYESQPAYQSILNIARRAIPSVAGMANVSQGITAL